ncbi:BF3164 family lipoprotein [Algoriphagus antarcticus]|nr:BF3164 family lipoprotein [Algoriphagus antarcticus]
MGTKENIIMGLPYRIKMQVYYVYLLPFLLFRCSYPPINDYSFSETKELQSHSFSSYRIGYDYLIDKIDNYLIVVSFKNGDLISVYDADSQRLLMHGASNGEGENELLAPVALYVDKQERSFYIYDGMKQRQFKYDLGEIMKNGEIGTSVSIRLPSSGDFMNPVIPLGKGINLTMTYDKEGHFMFFDKEGEVVGKLGEFEKMDVRGDDIPDMIYGLIWKGKYAVNKSRKLVIKAYMDYSRISFFDMEANLLKDIWTGNKDMLTVEFDGQNVIKKGERKIHYGSVKVTDSFVYALYSGEGYDNDYSVFPGKEIHVFDYDGNRVSRYLLDKLVSDFCIDEEGNRIFGVNFTSDEEVIVFNL